MRKILALVVTMVVLFYGFAANALAASEITPRYSNVDEQSVAFTIENGVGTVDIYYMSMSTTFSKAVITVTVQKRNLLFFWRNVEFPANDNPWIIESTNKTGAFTKAYRLIAFGEGNYRVKVVMEFYGTDDTVDEIELYRDVRYTTE